MRTFFAALLMGMTGIALAQGGGGKVEVKGPHICCNQCIKVAKGLLAKVDGVSDAAPDQQTKIVTFTAKDEKAAKAGIKALIDGGFFGTASVDGKEVKLDVASPKPGDKADAVTVEKVHVCCGQCVTAVNKIFKDAKVTIDGKGPQKNVTVTGTGLDRAVVLESLRKAGFNGTLK